MEQKTYDVFISYSRKDYVDEKNNVIPGNEVSKIKEALTKAGISYWFDEEGVYAGDRFARMIVHHIKASSVFVFLSTKNSNQSRWAANEISTAISYKKKIIPVRIDDSIYHDSFILYINTLSHVDYFNNPDEGQRELIRSIKAYLEDLKAAETQKAADEQHKKKELERIKDEEEQHRKKLQKQLVDDIWTSVSGLNIEETKLEDERSKLIVKADEITDIKQRKSLKTEITESSPIRKKSQAEIKKLQEQVAELEAEQKSYVENNCELRKKLTEKDSENQSQLKEINLLKRKLRSSIFRKNKWMHIVYCCIIVILISLICFRSCVEQNFRNITRLFTDTKDNQEVPAADSILELCVDSVKFKMIWIEGGTFKMGAQSFDSSGVNYDSEADSDESPVHGVTLNSYYLGETEVTQALWKAVMKSEVTGDGGWENQYGKGDNYPACRVSYNFIVNSFIPKLNSLTGKNFRLPTEAEWEFAARNGKKLHECQGYKYAGGNSIGEVAWYTENSGGNTDTVKGRKPNELGLYDMSGNVYEWCLDRYNDYSDSDQVNSYGPSSGSNRVLRGGCWGNFAKYCRVSSRSGCDPSRGSTYVGFRLCLPQPTSPKRP